MAAVTTEEDTTMEKEFLVHAQYSVPYAETVNAVRDALEVDGYTGVHFATNYAVHGVLVATVPA